MARSARKAHARPHGRPPATPPSRPTIIIASDPIAPASHGRSSAPRRPAVLALGRRPRVVGGRRAAASKPAPPSPSAGAGARRAASRAAMASCFSTAVLTRSKASATASFLP